MKRTVRIVVLILVVLTLVPMPVTSVIAASSSGQGLSKDQTQIAGQAAPVRQVSKPAARQSLVKNTVEMKNGEKAIVVLQTRNNLITIFSGDNNLLYSVSTESGISLAERLTASELKARFPELYDIATGVAWAGMQQMKSGLKR